MEKIYSYIIKYYLKILLKEFKCYPFENDYFNESIFKKVIL